MEELEYQHLLLEDGVYRSDGDLGSNVSATGVNVCSGETDLLISRRTRIGPRNQKSDGIACAMARHLLGFLEYQEA